MRGKDIVCEKCGKSMQFETIHTINGEEDFLDKKLYDVGIPLYHIIAVRKGMKYVYYELSKDKNEVLGGLFE